ncbi:MAG: carboxypeptidase-like regulatory domain-containing protein [Acidobacteriaceae bacterium]
MFPVIRRAFAVVAVALSIGAFGQARSDAPADAVNISGRVVSSTGAPVVGATVIFVWISDDGLSSKNNKVITNGQGEFAVSSERNAYYQILLGVPNEPPDEATAMVTSVRIAEGREVSLGDAVLEFSPERKPFVHLTGPVRIKGLRRTPGSAQASTIAGVYLDCAMTRSCEQNVLHIILGDGEDVQAPANKEQIDGENQVGVDSPLISEDRRVLGWLAQYDECCQSYPLSMKLVVFRPGKPLREFEGDGRGIFGWHLLDGGRRVAFYQSFAHGTPMAHYELRDVASAKLLGKWDDNDRGEAPAWMKVFEASSGSAPVVAQGGKEAEESVAQEPAAVPPDLQQVLLQAARTKGLSVEDMKPWHLRATYQVANAQALERGTFEEWWAGPEKYRIIYSSDRFYQEWDRNGAITRIVGDKKQPFMLDALLEPLLVDLLPLENEVGMQKSAVDAVKKGGVAVSCFGPDAQARHAGRSMICLDPKAQQVMIGAPDEQIKGYAYRIESMNGRFVAREITVLKGQDMALSINLEVLEPLQKPNNWFDLPAPVVKAAKAAHSTTVYWPAPVADIPPPERPVVPAATGGD